MTLKKNKNLLGQNNAFYRKNILYFPVIYNIDQI